MSEQNQGDEDLVQQFRERLEGTGLDPDEQELQEAAQQMVAEMPLNPKNGTLQPLPTAVTMGVLDSSQGPVAAATFMHPAGEYTFMCQDPQEIDSLIRQLTELKADLLQRNLRHQLLNPAGGLVVPTPNVPGANGAMKL